MSTVGNAAHVERIRAAILDSSGAPGIDLRARALDSLDALAAAAAREQALARALEIAKDALRDDGDWTTLDAIGAALAVGGEQPQQESGDA